MNDTWGGPTNGTACDGVMLNGFLYFLASNAKKGSELWRSNGTPSGTTRVTDINPGAGNADPGFPVVIGSTLYFSANDGTHGVEPFKYVP